MDSSRRKSDPVVAKMLAVALAQIERDGMTVGLEQVRMEDVIKAAGVSRATAYRRWPGRDDFLADVLVAVVGQTSLLPETPADVAQLRSLLADYASRLDDPQARRDLVVEGLRISIDADVRRLLAAPHWRTYLALNATLPGLPAGRVQDAVRAALVATQEEFDAHRAGVYGNLAEMIGYRVRADGDDALLELSRGAGAMMIGVLLRALSNPGLLDDRRPAALFGSSVAADWSQPERLLAGYVLAHLEPDPRARFDARDIRARLNRFESTAELLEPSSR